MNINRKNNIIKEIQNDQQNDSIEDGIDKSEFVLQKCPFSVDALFLFGQAYNEVNRYYNALVCLGMAEHINCFIMILIGYYLTVNFVWI